MNNLLPESSVGPQKGANPLFTTNKNIIAGNISKLTDATRTAQISSGSHADRFFFGIDGAGPSKKGNKFTDSLDTNRLITSSVPGSKHQQ